MSGRLTVADVRAAGFCLSGVRRQCAVLGVDFRQFVREGVPLEVAAAVDDALVQKAVEIARKREEGSHG